MNCSDTAQGGCFNNCTSGCKGTCGQGCKGEAEVYNGESLPKI